MTVHTKCFIAFRSYSFLISKVIKLVISGITNYQTKTALSLVSTFLQQLKALRVFCCLIKCFEMKFYFVFGILLLKNLVYTKVEMLEALEAVFPTLSNLYFLEFRIHQWWSLRVEQPVYSAMDVKNWNNLNTFRIHFGVTNQFCCKLLVTLQYFLLLCLIDC